MNLEGCTAVLQLADQYTEVYAAVGVHPNSAADWQDDWIDAIRNFINMQKLAIGRNWSGLLLGQSAKSCAAAML